MQESSQKSSPIINLPESPPRRKARNNAGASTTTPLTGIDYVRQVLYTMREFGVTKFQQGDLHLELGPVPQPLSVPDAEPVIVAGPPQKPLSDEDLLFWSADALETKESV